MSSRVVNKVICSRFICRLFHTLCLPSCATTPHWTLILTVLSHTYSYTLSHLYSPAFLQLSRTKSSKVQSKLPPSREDYFSYTHRAHWKAYNAVGSFLALHCSAVVFALLCSKLSLCSEISKVLAWQTHSDPSEAAQQENVLWSFLQQPDSRCYHSGNAAAFWLICCSLCFSFLFLYCCLLLHYVQWEKTRSRNLSDSVFVIWAYKATINSRAVTIRHEFCYVPDILSSVLSHQTFTWIYNNLEQTHFQHAHALQYVALCRTPIYSKYYSRNCIYTLYNDWFVVMHYFKVGQAPLEFSIMLIAP